MTRISALLTLCRSKMRESRGHNAATAAMNAKVLVFPVPESDVGLITALRAGHADAVRLLCERHSLYLKRVAARVLGPDAALSHVVAEALRHALHSVDQLAEPRALRTWLVCRLMAVVRRRLRARQRWYWAHPLNTTVPWRDGLPWSDQLVATYRVLDRLSVDQRIAFCLMTIQSMGLAETAMVLGVPLGQARSTFHKACKRFNRYSRNEISIQSRRLCG
ncbi:MAG TPA: sigma factor [Polyangiaceae bacterium]